MLLVAVVSTAATVAYANEMPTGKQCTNGGLFLMGQRTVEYQGYLAATQSLNGLIHLV